jgi:hypothetical protein
MADEPQTAREYAEQGEEHARRALRAYRSSLKHARLRAQVAEHDAQAALAVINSVKQVMYEQGWTEE